MAAKRDMGSLYVLEKNFRSTDFEITAGTPTGEGQSAQHSPNPRLSRKLESSKKIFYFNTRDANKNSGGIVAKAIKLDSGVTVTVESQCKITKSEKLKVQNMIRK